MGTEVVALPGAGEDQEEGEIIDVEAYNHDFMDLESISSEEEENLRDRIKELETRNKELEKLAAVAKQERRTYNYDNSDFVTISSSEEDYYEPKYNKFDVRMLHPNGRKINGMSRGKNRKTNLRYKSPEKFRNDIVSPDFKRRRSLSPEYYQQQSKNRSRERVKYDKGSYNEHHRAKKEHKKRRKRSLKRHYSESESENEKYVRSQLNAALKRDTQVSTMNVDNPLMRKLKLRPGSANKENEQSSTNGDIGARKESDDEEDDELIALRLQALKSKQEVKELIKEVPINSNESKSTSDPLPELKADDFDQEELELRMIALKSAIVKKAVARKKQNEKPYSPTDGLEWTPASPDNPYASSSESNMQISPAISPTLDDAVLQPLVVDMEIATPDNMSNSPTFYSTFDEPMSKVTTPPMQDFSNPWTSIIPIPTMMVPLVITQPIVQIIPKTTKHGLPYEMFSRPVRDELNNVRSNTQSPQSCMQVMALSDISSTNLRPRSRSLDSLQVNVESTKEVNPPKSSESMEDEEEQALRTLLLAKMSSPNRVSKKSVPSEIKSINQNGSINDTELPNIEANLKRMANRFKELSEQEEELIDASLDKILSNEKPEKIMKSPKQPIVSLKDVVERLKLSQAKEKLSKVMDKLPVEASKPDETVIEVEPEKTPERPLVDQDKPKPIPDVVTPPAVVKISKPPQTKAISKLKPKQITNAMSSIVASTLPKPKHPVLTNKPAPVIMKRKLKTKSSIINVPFQHKTTTTTAVKPPTNNIPSTSSSILSLENVIKPVPKVIIRLGQSSSDDSDTDSDTMTEANDSSMNVSYSAVASPSHINEINGVPSPTTTTTTPKTVNKNPIKPLPKVDPSFEIKLDEFLKQARAKTENANEIVKTTKGKIAPKIVQKTPSAVRHLPLSSQIEYKNLLAKMQQLEKQKQSRLKSPKKVEVEPGGNIKVTVGNDSPNDQKSIPTRTISESSEGFESRLSKMSEEQKDKALEKYEMNYKDFSLQFETQLTEFMDTITEATEEKRKQIQLEMEAEELRAKLAAVESQLNFQRDKVSKIYPKISTAHKKILASRDKYVKMGKCCTKLGQTVKGTDYQFKNEAKEKIFEKLKQLPGKTKKLKNAKAEYLKELSGKNDTEKPHNTNNSYQSVLDCMSSTITGTTTNHDGVLCPFDLSGKCSDKECKYVHLS